MSASNNPTLHPVFFNAIAIFVANVDFPTPPFALEIAIVNFVPLIGFFTKDFCRGFVSINSTYLVFLDKDTIYIVI